MNYHQLNVYQITKDVFQDKTFHSAIWAPFQYPIRSLIVRSREVSKLRDRQFKLSYRSAAELPAKFHSDRTNILNTHLAASRLHETLR